PGLTPVASFRCYFASSISPAGRTPPRPSLPASAGRPGATRGQATVLEEGALGLAVEVRHARLAVEAIVAARVELRHAAAARGCAPRLTRRRVDVRPA